MDKIENISILISFVLVVGSFILHRMRKAPTNMSMKESLSNIVIFIIWKFGFYSIGLAFQYGILKYISKYALFQLPMTALSVAYAVLLMDFCYYWKHRNEHNIGFLWCQHAVHHSSKEYNFSTSLRLPWIGSFLNWPFFIPALFLGLSPELIIIGNKAVLAYQYLVHTEYVRSLGIFEKVLNTPSHHRVHHASNSEYIDKNFGGILIIWDKAFGTFTKETIQPIYGTLRDIGTSNPFMINVKPWIEYFNSFEFPKVRLVRLISLLLKSVK